MNETADHEAQLQQALHVLVEHQRVSKSLLQQHLRIGYKKAVQLLEELEQRGMLADARLTAEGKPAQSSAADGVLAAQAAKEHRKQVVLMRVTDEMAQHLDNLVAMSLAGSRSEAAYMLAAEGIKANAELLHRIAVDTETIRQLHSELEQTYALDKFGKEEQKDSARNE